MKYLNIKVIGGIVLIGLAAFFIQTQFRADGPVEQMDQLLSKTFKADGPGAAVLMVRDGKVIFRKAYGMGNIEQNIALTPDMVFRIGSMTKQFTAAAIMKLVESGKLNLNDPLTKFIPDYPVQGYVITVEHLLTHTSGIMNYTAMPILRKIFKQDMTVDEVIDIFKDEPMDFAPGERFRYNNSGYILLGKIIEEVSGKAYEDFIQDEIFIPLGMENSYYGSFTKIISGRVMGYSAPRNKPLENAGYISMRLPYAGGSLLSTVDDLRKWNDALFAGKVVSEASLKKMTTPFELPDGKGNDYGYGLMMNELNGHAVIGHGGGIPGFSTKMQVMVEEDLFGVILVNYSSSPVSPTSLLNQLFAMALGEKIPAPEKVTVSAEIMKKYAGEYTVKWIGKSFRIVYKKDRLYAYIGRKSELAASSETEFFEVKGSTRLSFELDDKGDVALVTISREGGGRSMTAVPVK